MSLLMSEPSSYIFTNCWIDVVPFEPAIVTVHIRSKTTVIKYLLVNAIFCLLMFMIII